MIKKVIKIHKEENCNDEVELSWFDMQKPNLTAISAKNVNFIVKVKFTHLHENDVLICEDGYKIKVIKAVDNIYEINFTKHLDFAKVAYEIGNRHQAINLEDMKITILDDLSILDIIKNISNNKNIKVNKTTGYFRPNGNAHHSH